MDPIDIAPVTTKSPDTPVAPENDACAGSAAAAASRTTHRGLDTIKEFVIDSSLFERDMSEAGITFNAYNSSEVSEALLPVFTEMASGVTLLLNTDQRLLDHFATLNLGSESGDNRVSVVYPCGTNDFKVFEVDDKDVKKLTDLLVTQYAHPCRIDVRLPPCNEWQGWSNVTRMMEEINEKDEAGVQFMENTQSCIQAPYLGKVTKYSTRMQDTLMNAIGLITGGTSLAVDMAYTANVTPDVIPPPNEFPGLIYKNLGVFIREFYTVIEDENGIIWAACNWHPLPTLIKLAYLVAPGPSQVRELLNLAPEEAGDAISSVSGAFSIPIASFRSSANAGVEAVLERWNDEVSSEGKAVVVDFRGTACELEGSVEDLLSMFESSMDLKPSESVVPV